uniref:MICOS complex subunit MIC10 n=1 Tax=Nomascus leucogenys TaxID=61853 RepID=A0A2I3HS06_NOMLE
MSELKPGRKWDRCLADAVVKTGTGFGRMWPLASGSGMGLGMAPYLLLGKYVKEQEQ